MTLADEPLQDRLGYRFAKSVLLDRALTHSSAIPELRAEHIAAPTPGLLPQNNEQLEFLGDAVLDMLASEYLLATFPDWSEGQLSKGRARLVNANSLEVAARRLQLGEYLRLGRGEEKTGGRDKPAILADAFEAVIAAIYLDGGLEATREVLNRVLFTHAMQDRDEAIWESDRKSALQEFLQARGQPPADYRLAKESGPDHQKTFCIEVWIGGQRQSSGEGTTKKEAEQRAARSALDQLQHAAGA
ncbi:MAG TPA: ribonuclease III [Candidatus Acidoferrum sp.]|jgi:ribonuclease-3